MVPAFEFHVAVCNLLIRYGSTALLKGIINGEIQSLNLKNEISREDNIL